VAAIHPFYTAAIREFQAAGRTIVGSAPVRVTTARWTGWRPSGRAYNVAEARGSPPHRTRLGRDQGRALAANPIKGRITLSGYEGSELLVARLLIESGAECRMSAQPARGRNGTPSGS
jgi:3,8-divinyl chlorophyllide a/chlorophyllide a reductase subunit Y